MPRRPLHLSAVGGFHAPALVLAVALGAASASGCGAAAPAPVTVHAEGPRAEPEPAREPLALPADDPALPARGAAVTSSADVLASLVSITQQMDTGLFAEHALLARGVLVVDAAAPGAPLCTTTGLELYELDSLRCDDALTRCVGESLDGTDVLLLGRSRDGGRVLEAAVRYGERPAPAAEDADVLAALATRNTVCGLHDAVAVASVVLIAPSYWQVELDDAHHPLARPVCGAEAIERQRRLLEVLARRARSCDAVRCEFSPASPMEPLLYAAPGPSGPLIAAYVRGEARESHLAVLGALSGPPACP